MNNPFIKIKYKEKNMGDFFRINPHRHWNLLLSIFLVAVFALIAFSFYLLYEIKNEKIFQVSIAEKTTSTLLKEPLLKSINEIYSKRAVNVLDINSKPSIYSDPSL